MTTPIRPLARELWAEELRNGPIKQLREELTKGWVEDEHRPEQACCLGVLTAIAIKQGVENVRWAEDGGGSDPVEVFDDDGWRSDGCPEYSDGYWAPFNDNDLPWPVAKWAFGRHTSNPELRDSTTAITLNDSEQLSFAEIATCVEALPDARS